MTSHSYIYYGVHLSGNILTTDDGSEVDEVILKVTDDKDTLSNEIITNTYGKKLTNTVNKKNLCRVGIEIYKQFENFVPSLTHLEIDSSVGYKLFEITRGIGGMTEFELQI